MTATEAQLMAVWRQLLPEGRQVYLHDAGVLEVDLVTLNPILRRQGVEIAFQKAETSPRLVKVKTASAKYEAGTRFWLVAATPEAEEPRDPKTGVPLRFIARF